jgi:hypothetical protein
VFEMEYGISSQFLGSKPTRMKVKE